MPKIPKMSKAKATLQPRSNICKIDQHCFQENWLKAKAKSQTNHKNPRTKEFKAKFQLLAAQSDKTIQKTMKN